MSRPATSTAEVLGYAVGVGLAAVPLLGIPLRFLYPVVQPLTWYLLAFLAGVAVGAAWASWRRAARARRP